MLKQWFYDNKYWILIRKCCIFNFSSSSKRDPIMSIIDGKTYWTPDVDIKPYKGQNFPIFEDVFAFYKEYAWKSGFETIIASTKAIKGVKDFSFDFSIGSKRESIGLFWADEEAKQNYNVFGDVAFAALYRTNKYRMIFVPFTVGKSYGKNRCFEKVVRSHLE
uniref:Uncharacterized protein n=1 Tax=Lactuca sativa TaxID=4236 RepID=A0A9R1UJA4_LACSA|nr:hypothetical protein LSAT_V11C900492440 [Lactuca sativa]